MQKSHNDGTTAQDLVAEVLVDLEQFHRMTFVRLYDSKSAGYGQGGNLIPPQPADFIVAGRNGAFLLEVKSSITAESLADTAVKSMFKPNQISGAKLWCRAGQRAVCVFYSLRTKLFEVWPMAPIWEAYGQGPRKRGLVQITPPGEYTKHSCLCACNAQGSDSSMGWRYLTKPMLLDVLKNF